nr:hypothetical protein [Pedobacter panaciterrae]
MENQDQLPEEEIINPEQFQAGRNPEDQEDEENQNGTAETEHAGYTPGETEFADGEGTRLDQESEELEIDLEAEDLDDSDIDTGNDPDSGSSSEEDEDFEHPEDDPS